MFKRLTIIVAGLLSSCAGSPPAHLGLKGSQLPPCPDTPNCAFESIMLAAPVSNSWPAMLEILAQQPGCKIVAQTDYYCHAECHSRVFRFVDDVELHLDENILKVTVRSAARLGYSDFGVNRRRLETYGATLVEKGIASQSPRNGQ